MKSAFKTIADILFVFFKKRSAYVCRKMLEILKVNSIYSMVFLSLAQQFLAHMGTLRPSPHSEEEQEITFALFPYRMEQ